MKNISDLMADVLGEPDAVVTGTCATHGDFEQRYVAREGREPPTPICLECDRERRDAEAAAEREAHAAKVAEQCRQNRLNAIDLPTRAREGYRKPFDPPNEKAASHLETCRAYATEWPDVRAEGRNLILTGLPGTGKTHLASVICEHVANAHGKQPRYTTAARLLRHIRGSYNRDADYTETEAIEFYASASLLVVDEIGVKLASDNDRALLFEVIDERYQRLHPTIVISNLSIGEIAQSTDERMVDRLAENGRVLVFDWPSHRGQAS